MLEDHAVSLDLSGRVAIVTGASRLEGIGAAICLALASHGADVLFTHWLKYDQLHGVPDDGSGVGELEDRLRAMGSKAHALEVDLSKPGAAIEVLDVTRDALGSPSILVNNAAHSTTDGYERLDAAMLDAHHSVNVRSMALLSVEFARHFEGGSGGRIINLTSGQGVGPMPDELAYAASKGAVEAFTVSLAAGVAEKGITVNAIDPGATDTGWMSDDLKAAIIRRMAFGRFGQPSDAARLAVFLASDAGQWITCQIIHSRGA
jgi:3-oxoacyl-[acyl-carrier protein] reductase